MPFKSQAQSRFMFANYPEMAKHWAKETPNMKSLPDKKSILKNVIKPYKKDGKGGGSLGSLLKGDARFIAPYKNAYYRRVLAARTFRRIARQTGLMPPAKKGRPKGS